MSKPDRIERTDELGRKLVIRKMTLLEQMDLMEAAGDASSNSRWWNAAVTACSIRHIDDKPVPMPTTRKQIREHIELVAEEGANAAMRALNPGLFDDNDDDVSEAKARTDAEAVAAGN